MVESSPRRASATSVGALATSVSALVAGRLGRRSSIRLMLLVMGVAGVATSLPMSVAANAWQFLLLRALFGLLAAGAIALAYAAGGSAASVGSSGSVFSTLSMGAQIGSASSPFVVGLLANRTLAGVFVLDATLHSLATLATRWLRDTKRGNGP